ncbi:protein-tyrosine phosphatase [Microbacterium resistens]|uniref:Protein-tyrosine phosphatase n=1 Tax=Microbacterium resistens TaxID=156977 RepID=A0ABU1S9X5_9MICO|nr:tyrosine-protein phosphatase [Microbacterium resistens]MDR6866409.1 protein-tyrosine phosphatase [Microbacterium resistens]
MTILDVAGAVNLRDVGGISVGTSRVREGVLLRSGQLAGLTPEGSASLRARIRRVVDLRDDAEVAREPSAIGDVPVTRIPLLLGSVASLFTTDMSLEGMYAHLVQDAAPRMADVMRVIAVGDPTLVHCTAGKDRTGVSVAIALSAVGADREAVIADYALTESLLPASRRESIVRYLSARHPDAQHAIALAVTSPAPVMRALLEGIDERHGSVAEYLLASGLSPAELDALGAALVE